MKKVSKILAAIVNKAAHKGAGNASQWSAFQPKEPKILTKEQDNTKMPYIRLE